MKKTESELAQRIREVIGAEIESVPAFGRRHGIDQATLRKYLSGAVPTTDNLIDLIAIADAGSVNILWLAAGRGPKMRGPVAQPAPDQALDEQFLACSIDAIKDGLSAVGRVLPPDKHAKLIQAAYNLFRQSDKDKIEGQAKVVEFIKLTLALTA